MKLLLENWRKYLKEEAEPLDEMVVDGSTSWGLIIKGDQMIPKMVGYNASSAVFDQFDNSR